MFTTERLTLREFRPETDTADYLRLRNNVEIQRTMSADYIVPITRKTAEKRFDAFNGGNFLMHAVVSLRETGTFIGFASVIQNNAKNRDGALGIAILPEYWSKGYGMEAMVFVVDYCFENLNLHRVSMGIFSGNERALGLYKKSGFVLEGTRRQANWVDGKWEDTFNMGMLEHEWRENKAQRVAAAKEKAAAKAAAIASEAEENSATLLTKTAPVMTNGKA